MDTLLEKQTLFPNEDVHFHLNDRDHFFPHLHSHDFFEVFAVLNGSVYHSIDGREETLSAGSAALIYPQNRHKIATQNGCLVLCISFSAGLMEQISRLLKLDPFRIPRRHFFFSEELDELLRESKRVAVSQDPRVRESLLTSMLVACLSRFNAAPIPYQASYPEWFSILLARLARPEIFTRETREICELAGYTPEYVSRCFQKYLQTTLTEYLQKMRIRYARGLLLSTDMTILDICYECGFHNLSHFYHCFHKICGISPKRYRDWNGASQPQ